jgi:hypothetical protein
MDVLRLEGMQGQSALSGDESLELLASPTDMPNGPILERAQIAEGRAVGFDPFGVRIGWRNRFRGWDDSGLPKIADEAVENGLYLGSRRKFGSELRQKGLHRQGELRDIQRTSLTDEFSETEQVGSILLHGLGRVALRGQVGEITGEVFLE